VGQQIPLEGLIVLPNGGIRLDEEVFIVAENINDHQANASEEEILGARPRIAL
jgi:hypothetical protein